MKHALLFSLGLSLIATGCHNGASSGAHPDQSKGGSRLPLQHLFVIMMENRGADGILGNLEDAPNLNRLAQGGGVALKFFGVTHPSMPNYLALISGDFQGVFDDCGAGPDVTCAPEEFIPSADDGTVDALLSPEQIASASRTRHWFTGRTLVDQLEASHRTWKAYLEGLPAVGSTVTFAPEVDDAIKEVRGGLYAQRHNPFMYFTSIRNNPERMKRIVPATQLAIDLRSAATTPSFVWLSPDNCHNMHGLAKEEAAFLGMPECASPDHGPDRKVVSLGDAYVGSVVKDIMASPAWQERSAIVIVWDEDDFTGHEGCCGGPTTSDGRPLGGGRAPLVVLTSHDPRRRTVAQPSNHYTLLATIQRMWGLDCLGHACQIGDGELLTELFR